MVSAAGKPSARAARAAQRSARRADDVDVDVDVGAEQSARRATTLDYTRPILRQVYDMDLAAYDTWVHRTAHQELRAANITALRLFESDVLETCLTRTPWFAVPLVWLPVLAYNAWVAARALPAYAVALYAVLGLVDWSAFEYFLHRVVFHRAPTRHWGAVCHYAFHGIHHSSPRDAQRLVFPVVPSALVYVAFSAALRAALGAEAAAALTAGMLGGYLVYDLGHFAIHFAPAWLPFPSARLRRHHLAHHYAAPHTRFGVSSRVFDVLFGT